MRKRERFLTDFARNGQDEEASRILCAAVARLHAHPHQPPSFLVPLTQWFSDLEACASRSGGIFHLCAQTARTLLSIQQDLVVSHGDIHHGNVLDFRMQGWRAIDPKGLWGKRGYDYANLFCNADHSIATGPGRVIRQVDIVSEASDIHRRRLLQWILAYAGLSAAWAINDKEAALQSL